MGSVIAFFKSAYSILKMVKEVVSLFKQVYAMRLKAEHERRMQTIDDRASGIDTEIGRPVDDFDHERVRDLLRSRLNQ